VLGTIEGRNPKRSAFGQSVPKAIPLKKTAKPLNTPIESCQSEQFRDMSRAICTAHAPHLVAKDATQVPLLSRNHYPSARFISYTHADISGKTAALAKQPDGALSDEQAIIYGLPDKVFQKSNLLLADLAFNKALEVIDRFLKRDRFLVNPTQLIDLPIQSVIQFVWDTFACHLTTPHITVRLHCFGSPKT